MPICRICQHNNPPRAIVCHQCGIHLDQDVLQGNVTPTKLSKLPLPIFTLHISPSDVRLNVYSETIIISPDSHIYIGRDFPPQFSNTHIDLGPYDARSFGLSRIHARIENDLFLNYCIVDLGSTNGTLLNNQLITAFRSHPLADDDLLSFGDFPILIRIAA
jgi:pSer/pThr/pTyr-binding forkhead associated (FHA) protein